MPLDFHLGELGVRTIGDAGNLLDRFEASFDDCLGVAFDEYFADEVGVREFGARGEVGGVVCFG